MIRSYLPGDEAGINALYHSVFGKTRSIEEWKWKFNEFSVAAPIIIVAELDGKIVGHAACLKIPGTYKGQELLLGERVDIMVHPEYQGRGIYKNIVNRMIEECKNQHIDILYGFPAQTAKEVFLKNAGGKDLGNIPRFLAVQRPGALIGAKVPALAKPAKIIDFPYRLFTKKKTSYQLQEYQGDHAEIIDELYNRYATTYPVHATRNSVYIKKRFLAHPTRNYKVYLIMKEQNAVGYTVCSTESNENGLTTGTILDLWAKPEVAVLADMFRAIRNHLDADLINCWAVTDSERYAALKAAGFRHINSPMPFVIKTFNEKLDVSNQAAWHLSQSDVDSY